MPVPLHMQVQKHCMGGYSLLQRENLSHTPAQAQDVYAHLTGTRVLTLKARLCCSRKRRGALATKVTLWSLTGKMTAKRPSSSRHHLHSNPN